MKYVVKYKNPNNIVLVDKVYEFETHSKKDLDKFLKRAKEYNGSYSIVSVDKVSEAKKKIKKCPICKKNELREPGRNALSRKDNKTEICSECGNQEAMAELKKYLESH